MSTFFEKLKKGMEIEELPEKEITEEKKPLKKKERKAKKEKIVEEEKERKFEIKVREEPAVFRLQLDMAGEKEKAEKKWFQIEGQLTVDVYQTDKDIVIQSAVAGVSPGDLDIAIEKDVVTIKGKREKLVEKEERNYFYQECYWGQFSRKIILPAEVDASRIQATMRKGILTIRVPKIDKEKKRKITVEE